MNATEFVMDALEAPNSVNVHTAKQIRFHARSCHYANRSEYIMLRQVARNYGYTRNVLDIARDEWSKHNYVSCATVPGC